ncbi:hypothetical protein FA95DRAFT_1563154 [Auriscalpium vulgare]|uniref:Uncharacterized protein n=1 Tax=Auriscalpium vulgare TaxID=40419 RepID=A0ACB8RHF5_9AGAM|nr:hypothetical protein FA95DRAFT_1563154 [Auriscalpium vulgare]
MARSMTRPIALLIGDMYAATDDKGELVLFLPPGQNIFITEEQRQMGFYEFMGQLSDEGATTLGKDIPAFIDESVGIKETELKTYWCSFAMVRKDYQGKGIAKTMF